MSGTTKTYLSEIPDIFEHTLSILKQYNRAYISAPCGSGKTQFAKTIINQFAQSTGCQFSQILYLIDTLNGQSQLVQSDTSLFTKDHSDWHEVLHNQILFEGGFSDTAYHAEISTNLPPGVLVLTYARFIEILKRYSPIERDKFFTTIKLIVADEPHRLSEFARWSYGNQSKKDEYTYLRQLIFIPPTNPDHFNLVALSATFNPLDLQGLSPMCIDTSQCTGWLTTNTIKIKSIHSAIQTISQLKQQGKPYRTVVYAPFIRYMELYASYFSAAGLSATCIWSPHASKPMSVDQRQVLNHIITHHTVPDTCEVLILNASSETSINLNNNDFNVYVGWTSSQSSIVQSRGRIRKDIQYQFLHDPNGFNETEYANQLRQEVLHSLPPQYIGVHLTKEQLNQLVIQLNLRGKDNRYLSWPSVKLYYEQLGYICTSTRKQINGVRNTYYHFSQP